MSDKGKVGTLIMARNDIFSWQSSPLIYPVVLLRSPRGAGDVFEFMFDNGQEHHILLNGNSSDFIAFEEQPDE